MKRCPTCDRTFDDGMKFCQADGTALVDDAPAAPEAPLDPYATIVSMPKPAADADSVKTDEHVELTPAAPPAEEAPLLEIEPSEPGPSSASIGIPDDTLMSPSDPLKTMMVTEDEMKAAMAGINASESAIEPEADAIPPVDTTPEPTPPSFIAPADDLTPPPSPFTEADNQYESTPAEAATQIYQTEDIVPESAPPVVEEPAPAPVFEDQAPATVVSAPAAFEPPPPAPVEQWTPPPVPDAQWQNQQIGSDTPFQPPPAGVAGQSQGLAIGAMICGILSCLCCFSVITGPVGAIMGFIARKKATEDPANYGGAGFAMVGIISGILGFIIGVVLIVAQIFFGVLNGIAR